MKSDAELVKAALGGDRSAFGVLVERYERPVQAVATSILGDNHEAEDVAQDAFVTAHEKLAALRDGGAFGAWILSIARRAALRRARRRAPIVFVEGLTAAAGEHRDAGLGETSQQVLAAVTRLPQHERQVVMLKHFNGFAVRTIAEITGRPVGTVTKQLSRAYGRLRRLLEDLKR